MTGASSYIYRKSGNNSLVLYPGVASGSNGNTKYVLLPMFDEPLSNLYLNFWMCTESATNGVLDVGYVTGGDTTGFVSIATYPASPMTVHVNNGLQNGNGIDVELSLDSIPANATRLAFRWIYNGAYGVCLDDIVVSYPPACPTPTDMVRSNVMPHSVDLSWNSSASEFIVEYGRHGFVHGTGMTQTVYTNSVTLDNLDMGAIYDVYVTAVCGSDTSLLSLYDTVTTGCEAITGDDLPYTEDFEAYGTGSANPINACWTKGTNSSTAYPYPYSTAAINGSRGLYLYGYYPSTTTGVRTYSWAALPPVGDDLDMNDLMVTFNVKRGATASNYYTTLLYVGIADSVTGLNSANALDLTVTWIDTLDYFSEAASSVHSVEVSFADYMGTGKYVVFYAPIPSLVGSATYAYNYVYLDDVALRRIPTCYWPDEVSLDSVSYDAAAISWTPDPRTPNPSYWEVEYGVAGFVPGEGGYLQANDTTIVLNNLLANTVYDVYIKANCGGDVSDPEVFTFRTLCSPVAEESLPYVEDFEDYTSGSTNPISPCWIKQAFNTTTQYPYPYATAAITGNIGLYFYGNGTSNISNYVALPLFESNMNDLMVSFYLKRYNPYLT